MQNSASVTAVNLAANVLLAPSAWLGQFNDMNSRSTSGHYEHISEPLLPWRQFLQRLLRNTSIGVLIIAVSLIAGMLGYHLIVNLSWVDSYENAAMILSGMGPVSLPLTAAGKIFAGSYALYSGIAVLVTAGVLFAPLVHRLLHRLHADR
jgi:hypothetical protein